MQIMRYHYPLKKMLTRLMREKKLCKLYLLITLTSLSCVVHGQNYFPGGLGNANLELWLTAGDTTTLLNNSSTPVTRSGEKIFRWKDKSGKNHSAWQTTNANQPQYRSTLLNGMGGVVFNAINQFMTGSSGAYQTIVAVRSLPGPGHYETLFASPAHSDTSIRGGGQGTTYTDGPKISDWCYNTGTPPAQWLNGIQTLNSSSSDHLLVSTAASPSYKDYSISTKFLNRGMSGGDAVYELLAYSSPLNTTQRRILENYAAAGWGLTGLLPAATNTTFTPPSPSTFNKNLIGIGNTSPTDYFLANPIRYSDGLALSSGRGSTDFLNTEGFLMAAHNGQANTLLTDTTINGIGSGLSLWNRSWYLQKLGGNDRGYVTLDFNFNYYLVGGSLPSNYGNFYLLHNATDGTFSSGVNSVVAISQSLTHSNVQFYLQANFLATGYYTLMWSTPRTRLIVPGTQAICAGANTAITALTGKGFSYQWQVNTGAGYTNVPARDPGGAEYGGATTASLSISGVTAGMNGYTYQCLFTSIGLPAVVLGPASLTIKAVPPMPPITGTTQLLAGGSTTLSNNMPGGIWTTEKPALAQVNNSGMVTGLSNGSTSIKYTVTHPNGCNAAVSTNLTILTSRYFPGGLGNTQLQLWLDGADNGTLRTTGGQQAGNGDPVVTWYDKSSRSNHATQTQPNAHPVYQSNKLNNLGAVVFSDARKNLTGPLSMHQTIVAVRDLPGAGHYQTLFASPAHSDFSIQGGGGGTNYTDGPKATDWSFNTGNPPEQWYNGTRSLMSSRTPHIIIATAPSRLQNTYSISTSFIGRGMNGDDAVYELLSYDAKLNTTQRQILENYKAAKWGLSSSLPTAGYTTFIPPSITSFNKNLVGIGYTSNTDHFLANPVAGANGSTDGLGFSSGTGASDYLNRPGYLMAAHNGQSATILNNARISSISTQGGTGISRWNRSWYLQKTGGNSNGNVTLNFNFDDYYSGNAITSYTYSILYNASDGNFATGYNQLIPANNTMIAGNNIAFQVRANDLPNGYYTLVWSSSAILPLERKNVAATSPVDYKPGFSSYPNPSTGMVFITAPQFKGYVTIRLLTMDGRVLQKRDQQFDKKTAINISNYPAGMYLMEITAGGRIFHHLVKKL
jgi:hypothetical protein